MKSKYVFQLKRLLTICLSFLLSIGSFFGLFAVNASAYDTIPGGQLKLQSGVCYNGADPNHPFRYTTEKIGINNNTWLPEYDRGNTGAGGGTPGITDILMTRIDTGEAWSSVPLYRVSRSGGYSDNLPYVTGDTTDIVNADDIQSAVNTLSGINRKINIVESEMIRTVLKNGFKAGYETTGAGNSYSWSDNLRFVATKILVWEIQEGKRTGFGYEDYAEPGINNMVGGYGSWGVRYWKGYWDQLVWPQSYKGCANWYYQILDMCRATNSSISVVGGNTGTTTTATIRQSTAGRLNATYLSTANCYQLSMYLPDSSLWGNLAGQYNADSFQWQPDSGSGNANLSSSGNVVYLTSSSDEPISGYIKITQKQNSYNDVGYMSGGSTNSWRGFLFGGNREPLVLYLRVESVGDQRVKVKFVDSVTGSPVNVNWTFEAAGIGTEFSENSSGKNFVPQYWTSSGGANANYNININSVPGDYYMPLNTWTGFNFLNSVIKFGEGGTGWGECDYEKGGASFDGNNITIRLMKKKPININFVDANTGQPLKVDWAFYEYVSGVTLSENSSGTSYIPKYFEKERWQGNNEIQVKGVPEGYEMPEKINSPFVYDTWGGVIKWGDGGTGWVGNSTTGQWNNGDYAKSGATFNGNTITIAIKEKSGMTINFVDADTGEPVPVDFGMSRLSTIFYKTLFTEVNKSSYTWTPTLEQRGSLRITLNKVPAEYTISNASFNFGFKQGYIEETNPHADMKIVNKRTLEISIHKKVGNDIDIEYRNGLTGELFGNQEILWQVCGDNGYDKSGMNSQTIHSFPSSSEYTIEVFGAVFEPDGDFNQTVQNPITKFEFDGDRVLPSPNNANPSISISEYGDKLVVFLYPEGVEPETPVTIRFVDGETNEPMEVEWKFSEQGGYNESIEVSSGKTFIPENYSSPDGTMYEIQILNYPSGCYMSLYYPDEIIPCETIFGFIYDGRINQQLTEEVLTWDYGVRSANIYDYASNTITFRIFKEEEPVEPPEPEDNVQVEFIKPNSDYHYGEEVFSSFYVKNLSEKNYNPTEGTLDLEMKIEKGDGSTWGTFFSKNQSGVIVPGNGTQLAYFKWTVPTLPLFTGNEKYRIVSTVSLDGNVLNTSTSDINIASFTSSATPPAKFDLDGGKYFTLTNPIVRNQDYHNSASWQQYEWIDGKYAVKTYSNKLWTESITIKPDETNPSATFDTGTKQFTSRSGYAIKLALKPKIEQFEVSGTTLTPIVKEAQTTAVQRANAYFSENGFIKGLEKYDTLELVGENTFGFKVFEKSTYKPGERGDGRKHFIPMWFPDTEYVVQCVASSCWSPAGMLSYTDESNKIIINGSLYDDWYSSGNGR